MVPRLARDWTNLVGARAGIDILMIGVADECDCVIESITTVIGLLYNTAFVELEGGFACIKSNSERLLSQLGLYFSDTASDLLIGVDFAHGLALIVTAFVLSHGSTGVVGIVSVGHGAWSCMKSQA